MKKTYIPFYRALTLKYTNSGYSVMEGDSHVASFSTERAAQFFIDMTNRLLDEQRASE